jgi:hypothetical protein
MPDERRMAEDLPSFLADPGGLRLREPLGAGDAANQTTALYEGSGRDGATFSLRLGDMRGQGLYAVSVWPERGKKSAGDTVSVRILQLFIAENLDLLDDPRCSVGLWYNADEDVTYRDIVATLPSRQEAAALALQYDQIAIFDLRTLTEIETGGTGNTPADMPPATERLPKISPQEPDAQKEEQL